MSIFEEHYRRLGGIGRDKKFIGKVPTRKAMRKLVEEAEAKERDELLEMATGIALGHAQAFSAEAEATRSGNQ